MDESPIGMSDMQAVFAVTDELAISREKVEVPLLRRGEGAVRRLDNGKLEITLPVGTSAAEWVAEARQEIATVGQHLLGSAESP